MYLALQFKELNCRVCLLQLKGNPENFDFVDKKYPISERLLLGSGKAVNIKFVCFV